VEVLCLVVVEIIGNLVVVTVVLSLVVAGIVGNLVVVVLSLVILMVLNAS
jgi:hypothetical protein